MRLTEINVKPVESGERHRNGDGLYAIVSVVFDHELAVKNIKLVKVRGTFLLCMPRREKVKDCLSCGSKNEFLSAFCKDCGVKFTESVNEEERAFQDLVHPIDSSFRRYLEKEVIQEYRRVSPNDKNNPPKSS